MRYRRGKRSLVLYGQNWHLYAFKWGIARKRRRGENWHHASFSRRVFPWVNVPGRKSVSWSLETWQSRCGTTDRIPYTKRYIRLKWSA